MRETGANVLFPPCMVFKCDKCGNLHGAPVTTCGMCGSGAVSLVLEKQAASADVFLPDVTPDLQLDFTISAIDLMRAATAWLRQSTPTVREPESDPLTSDKWPGSGQRVE